MGENLQRQVSELAKLMVNNSPCYVLTGAGISTESGIPDYRSKGKGLWEKADPAEVASVDSLRRDPKKFYEFNLPRWNDNMGKAQPNVAHNVLAWLEEQGVINGIITQNVDSLHYKAGTKKLWEVHGHLRSGHCLKCKDSSTFDKMYKKFMEGENPPLCESCGGTIRPDVVLFGDAMSESFFDAEKILTGCELLLIVGTSLQVYPVAFLPEKANKIAIVNLEGTTYDDGADLVIKEKSGIVFEELQREVEKLINR